MGAAVAVGALVDEGVAVAAVVAVGLGVGDDAGAVSVAVGGEVAVSVAAGVAEGVVVAASVGVALGGSAGVFVAVGKAATAVKESVTVAVSVAVSTGDKGADGADVGGAAVSVAVAESVWPAAIAPLVATGTSWAVGDGGLFGDDGAAIHELGIKMIRKISSARVASMETPPINRQRAGVGGSGFVSSKTRYGLVLTEGVCVSRSVSSLCANAARISSTLA